MIKTALTRRRFLGLAAAPFFLPGRAHARDNRAARGIVTGHIGTGPRGQALVNALHAHVAAVCDVDDARLRQGASLTRAGVNTYTDYRELLERADIDAVVIATPHHWHAVQAVHACEAGKDIYLETPVCTSPIAGRKLLRAAARAGVVVHPGSEGTHTPAFAALRLAADGLGGVTEVVLWGDANPVTGEEAPGPVPDGLRWTTWLGPAPARPYCTGFVEEGWRWRLDFGGGQIMHQGAQLLECAITALDLPLNTNFTVSATGTAPLASPYDCPQPLDVVYEVESPAIRLVWSQGSTEGPGIELRGPNGSARATGIGPKMQVAPALLEKLPEDARNRAADPLADWMDAILSRRDRIAPLGRAILAGSMAALGNLSYRLGRPLHWDAASGTCKDDVVANRMLADPGSGPWRI